MKLDVATLQSIKDEAMSHTASPALVRSWWRAYDDLAQACEVLIAFEERSSIPIVPEVIS